MSPSCKLVDCETHGIKLIAELNAGITNGFERLLDPGFESQEVSVCLRLLGRILGFDGPRKNLGVSYAQFHGLGDKREGLVSHNGEGLALFRGECRANRQLALDGREMILRGLQRGGIVGR